MQIILFSCQLLLAWIFSSVIHCDKNDIIPEAVIGGEEKKNNQNQNYQQKQPNILDC